MSNVIRKNKSKSTLKPSGLLNAIKRTFSKNERAPSLDLDALGNAENVEQKVKILVDKKSKTGYKGLPQKWSEYLLNVGISAAEMEKFPAAARNVASIQFEGGIGELLKEYSSLQGSVNLQMLMKQIVDIKTTNPIDKYNVNYKKDRLGGGSFGDVFLCSDKENNTKFAMKVSTVEKITILEREIRMHALSNGHKNIVAFEEAYKFQKKIYLIVELMNGGSLFDYIYKLARKPRWKEKAISYAIKCILQGLAHMHARHHLHRDIKSQNILINSKGDIKIADFGFAVGLTKEHNKRHTVLGSPFWMSPELINKHPYGSKVDVWSTGVTAYEIAEHEPPHMGQSAVKVMFLITTKDSPKLTEKDKWTKTFHHFLKLALDKNPKTRPSSSELLMHPFFEKKNVCKRSAFAKLIANLKELDKKAKEKKKSSKN